MLFLDLTRMRKTEELIEELNIGLELNGSLDLKMLKGIGLKMQQLKLQLRLEFYIRAKYDRLFRIPSLQDK